MVSSKELFNVSSSGLVKFNITLAYIKLFSLEGARIELLIAWFAAKLLFIATYLSRNLLKRWFGRKKPTVTL